MKIKKLLCLLTTAVIAVSAFSFNASAYIGKYKSGGFTFILNEYTHYYGSVKIQHPATVTGIPSTQKVEIPEKVTYKGTEFTVTDVNLLYASFEAENIVEEIVLPETIYDITDLGGFSKLKKMNLPKNTMIGREYIGSDYGSDGEKHIEYYSDKAGFFDPEHCRYLEYCSNLKLSVDPDSKYYSYKNDMLLSKDEKTVYLSLNQNTDITIPDGVEKILSYGGVGFDHVKNVTLPDALKYFGGGSWSSLTKLTLPNSLEEIRALLGNSKITEITLLDSLKKIGWNVFKKSKLTKIVIPDSVKEIGGKAFADSKLKSVKFGKSLKFIGERAFYNCKNLKSVTIPASVIRIESDAFRNCQKIKNVKILSTDVQYIRSNAFENCKKLKTVTISGVEKFSADAFDNCKKLSKIVINNKKSAPKLFNADLGGFKNSKKGIKFVVKNKKVAKQLKKQLNKKKIKRNLKNAKILVGKKVVYKI